MAKIATEFEIKGGKYEEPTSFLGAGIKKFNVDGNEYWSMDSAHYVKNAVQVVEDLLAEDGRRLKGKNRPHASPLNVDYKPELDATPECNEEHSSRFRQIIGILRWAIELGRIDILTEVSLLSQYQACPREGHLEALYLIVHYLKLNPVRRIVFDPRKVENTVSRFNDGADWRDFYGDVEEEDPPHMPKPLGKSVKISCFVDSNHAGNVVTRRSHSGIIIFVNSAPIIAYSKRQNTVESSTFGSEFVAMRIAKELISALRIKLKSFGVPLDGPVDIYCDNAGVCNNAMFPESTLSKKHNAINYHTVREAAAAKMLRVAKEDTATNIADAFTKLMHYDRKHDLLSFLELN